MPNHSDYSLKFVRRGYPYYETEIVMLSMWSENGVTVRCMSVLDGTKMSDNMRRLLGVW